MSTTIPIMSWQERARIVIKERGSMTMAEKVALKNVAMKVEIDELRQALAGKVEVVNEDPPSDYMQLSKWEVDAFQRLRKTLGLVDSGLLDVMNIAEIRLRRYESELQSVPKMKYECSLYHENGMQLSWIPLDADSDAEADQLMNYGEKGIWRHT